MKLTRQDNIINIALDRITLDNCDSVTLSYTVNCCSDTTTECIFTKEYMCTRRYSMLKDDFDSGIITGIGTDSADCSNNPLNYTIHAYMWNNDEYSQLVSGLESYSGMNVNLWTDDTYIYIDFYTNWSSVLCGFITPDWTICLQTNTGAGFSLTASEHITDTRLVSNCDNITVSDNTIALETQNQGVYSISVSCNSDNTTTTESSCIALIDGLKCDIFKLQNEKTRLTAYLMYEALVNAVDCYCSCDKLCEMYEYLLSVLGKLNTGCYE